MQTCPALSRGDSVHSPVERTNKTGGREGSKRMVILFVRGVCLLLLSPSNAKSSFLEVSPDKQTEALLIVSNSSSSSSSSSGVPAGRLYMFFTFRVGLLLPGSQHPPHFEFSCGFSSRLALAETEDHKKQIMRHRWCSLGVDSLSPFSFFPSSKVCPSEFNCERVVIVAPVLPILLSLTSISSITFQSFIPTRSSISLSLSLSQKKTLK